MSLHNLGQEEDALAAAGKAVEIRSDFAEAWRYKGLILFHMGRYPEALEALDQALACDPGNAQLYYQKGRAFDGLARHEEASHEPHRPGA